MLVLLVIAIFSTVPIVVGKGGPVPVGGAGILTPFDT
jgi:hypothetical protein